MDPTRGNSSAEDLADAWLAKNGYPKPSYYDTFLSPTERICSWYGVHGHKVYPA